MSSNFSCSRGSSLNNLQIQVAAVAKGNRSGLEFPEVFIDNNVSSFSSVEVSNISFKGRIADVDGFVFMLGDTLFHPSLGSNEQVFYAPRAVIIGKKQGVYRITT